MFRKLALYLIFNGIAIFLTFSNVAAEENKVKRELTKQTFPGELRSWHGYAMYVDGKNRIVAPKKVADGKPWVWRARFFGVEPQFDLAMLERGYHVVYCDVGGLFGNAEAVKRWDEFYDYLRFEHLFADRVVLEGFSRGGLIVYNWAAKNPEKVAAIYADAPVMDFKSWPGVNKVIMQAYGFKNEEEAKLYKLNPVDNLAPIAKAGVPIIHVVGDADEVVPVAENTDIAEKRYKKMGGIFKVISKKGVKHHPHSLKDPKPIEDFIVKHTEQKAKISAEDIVSEHNFTLRGTLQNSRIQFENEKKGHVAFIGGSITEMNGYRPKVMNMLKKRFPETKFTFTDAGISSTCSDTGAFRLRSDVLSQGALDLLFVEFAVNDDQDSQQSYEDALRGMEGIVVQARRHNPNVDIVMTMFVNENILAKLHVGEVTDSLAAHQKVAAHYDVSVNHLAQELAELIRAGKMDWKKFGGVHPNNYGNTMCARMIQHGLAKAWGQPLADTVMPMPYEEKLAIDPLSYTQGRFLPFNDVEYDANWALEGKGWVDKVLGKVRPRFHDDEVLAGTKAGSKLRVRFSGKAIGAYLLTGPDAGVIRCTIDGKESKEIDLLHKHSNFHYPMTKMFFNELEDGEHVLELELLENREGRIKRGGTALRVLRFVGN